MKVFHGSPLSPSLANRLWATLTAPQPKPRPEVVVHGPKVRRATCHPSTRGSDELILEIRRLREVEKMFPAQIRDRLRSMGFSLTKERITQIYQYTTRTHLVPHPEHGSYLKGEPDAQPHDHQEGTRALPPQGPPEGFPAQAAR